MPLTLSWIVLCTAVARANNGFNDFFSRGQYTLLKGVSYDLGGPKLSCDWQ